VDNVSRIRARRAGCSSAGSVALASDRYFWWTYQSREILTCAVWAEKNRTFGSCDLSGGLAVLEGTAHVMGRQTGDQSPGFGSRLELLKLMLEVLCQFGVGRGRGVKQMKDCLAEESAKRLCHGGSDLMDSPGRLARGRVPTTRGRKGSALEKGPAPPRPCCRCTLHCKRKRLWGV
jgi:hypothetical protein